MTEKLPEIKRTHSIAVLRVKQKEQKNPMQTEKVELILRKHLPSRDSDNELFIAWMFYESNLTEEQKQAFGILKEVIRSMPALESLTRARRSLQADNAYLRGENYNKRQTREKQIRKFYSNK